MSKKKEKLKVELEKITTFETIQTPHGTEINVADILIIIKDN